MSIDGFPFEGRDVTAAQLKRQGITYSEGVIQSALEAGCQSVSDLIAHCETRIARGRAQSFQAGKKAIRSVWGAK